jgi:predicted amidohydrolase
VEALRAAAVSWRIRDVQGVDGLFAHAEELLAVCEGCDLVVFPECVSLELLTAWPDLTPDRAPGVLADAIAGEIGRFGDIAKRRGVRWVAGTHFFASGEAVQNRAVYAGPDGLVVTDVPKVVMTQFEALEWGLAAGSGLRALPDHRIGVTVCYDCEFPASGRALAESGVLVQCVPAYTETRRGFQRVRWCCQARAVENQIFVLHSSLVGSLGREPVPNAVGTSAVLAPSVEPFPESAVLAETTWNEEGAAIAELDFDALAQARASNDVRNWADRDAGDWTVRPAATCEP